MRDTIRGLSKLARGLGKIPRLMVNPLYVTRLRHQKSLKVHLGCGDDRMEGFVNIDCRVTPSSDVVMDLKFPRFSRHSVELAFSHAFFEHLYRDSRITHMRQMRHALAPEGVCCYIGIPYFPNVARIYLGRGPGIVGPVFDLYNVYRYTHGDPEHQRSWWLQQLHKSLCDEKEIASLLMESGFNSFVSFCYAYPGEPKEAAVNMGFYARQGEHPFDELQAEAKKLLEEIAEAKIQFHTLKWLAA